MWLDESGKLLKIRLDRSPNRFTNRDPNLLLVVAELGQIGLVEPDRVFFAVAGLSLICHV